MQIINIYSVSGTNFVYSFNFLLEIEANDLRGGEQNV